LEEAVAERFFCGDSSVQPLVGSAGARQYCRQLDDLFKPDRQSGSDSKTMQISQDGSIISGRFKGPRQSGKIQGLVTGNHVEISTDTWVVLTFRGTVEGNTMSGLFGIRGRHASWYAQRTN
jgi:hypothetical protein